MSSEIDFALFTRLSSLLADHLRILLLHLVELANIRIVIDAALSTEPLANVENSTSLDELISALSCVGFQLAAKDIVELVPLQAESLAEFL